MTHEKTICARSGCEAEATLLPMLTFKAKNAPLDLPRARVQLPLPLCRDHADTDPHCYVSEDGWASIVAAMISRGKREPDRASLQVIFCALPKAAS